MIDQSTRKTALYNQGRTDALALQKEAPALTGTQIIRREVSVPDFDPARDYTSWPRMAPVADEGQVWLLLIPHNASHYPGSRPSTNRACWGLAHTTDPDRAKPWVDPYGTSGLYMEGECYRDKAGTVYRCKANDTAYDAQALPDKWEVVL